MMRNHLLLCCGLLLVSACKKEENDCPAPAPQSTSYDTDEFAQLNVGSYWVYKGVNIDPLTSLETPNGNSDSVYVAQDSVIAGNSYAWLKGTRFGGNWDRFVRVDGPRLIGPSGEVWMDVSALSDTISVSPAGFPIDSVATVLASQLQGISTLLGPMASEHERDLVFFMATGFTSPLHEREHYVRGVGIGMYSTFYAGSGVRVEMRLSNYHLE